MSDLTGIVVYLERSALVKRYLIETGSAWTKALYETTSGNVIVTARISYAETAAAFASKYRSGNLSQAEHDTVLQDLAYDFLHRYFLIEIDQPLVELAVRLIGRRKLRGYDAVQLASAITLKQTLTEAEPASLIFIAADRDLLQAAASEGLVTENPNLYP